MPTDPSFAAGTRIATPKGDAAIEDLAPGDTVLGPDDAPRRIAAVGLVAYSVRAGIAAGMAARARTE